MIYPSSKMMIDTVDIYRPTEVTDAYGSTSKTYALSSSGVVCSVQNSQNFRAIDADSERAQMIYDVYFRNTVDIQDGDKILLANGKYLDIDPPRDSAGRARVTHVTGSVSDGIDT